MRHPDITLADYFAVLELDQPGTEVARKVRWQQSLYFKKKLEERRLRRSELRRIAAITGEEFLEKIVRKPIIEDCD
jgi:hypothetical protein